MGNKWIAAAGIGGFAGVALGAAGRHLTAGDAYATSLIDTASRYLLIHAMALFGIGILSRSTKSGLLVVSGGFFVAGMVAFGGGLTLLALTGSGLANAATPVGGTAFLLGWLSLTAYGMLKA